MALAGEPSSTTVAVYGPAVRQSIFWCLPEVWMIPDMVCLATLAEDMERLA